MGGTLFKEVKVIKGRSLRSIILITLKEIVVLMMMNVVPTTDGCVFVIRNHRTHCCCSCVRGRSKQGWWVL